MSTFGSDGVARNATRWVPSRMGMRVTRSMTPESVAGDVASGDEIEAWSGGGASLAGADAEP